jgi:hypothetical protein
VTVSWVEKWQDINEPGRLKMQVNDKKGMKKGFNKKYLFKPISLDQY